MSALATDLGDDTQRVMDASDAERPGHIVQQMQVEVSGRLYYTDWVAADYTVAFRQAFLGRVSPTTSDGQLPNPTFGDSYEITSYSDTDGEPILNYEDDPVIPILIYHSQVTEWLLDSSSFLKGAKVRTVGSVPDPNGYVPTEVLATAVIHLTFTGYAAPVG